MDFIVASTRMERTEAILSWGRAGGGSYCSARQTVVLCRCCGFVCLSANVVALHM